MNMYGIAHITLFNTISTSVSSQTDDFNMTTVWVELTSQNRRNVLQQIHVYDQAPV